MHKIVFLVFWYTVCKSYTTLLENWNIIPLFLLRPLIKVVKNTTFHKQSGTVGSEISWGLNPHLPGLN